MANQTTRRSKNQTGSSAAVAGIRNRSASAGAVRRKRPARHSSAGFMGAFLGGLLELFRLTYFGRVIFVLFITALLVLLNILLSRNLFDLFFRLLGIEMILTAVIAWLCFLLRKN